MAWSVHIWKIYDFPKVRLYLEKFVIKHATAHIQNRWQQAKKHRTSNKNSDSFLYIENYRYVCIMNLKIATEIGKCLSNQIRFQILEWLKEPEKHFPPHETLKHFNDGVCVTYIQEKTELSQSTISTYLTNMEKCGLLISTRHGKWSYLKRNEETIKQFTDFLS